MGDERTQLILEDLLSVRSHADMRTNTHNSLLLAGIIASGAFAAGLISAGLERIEEFALLFLLVPALYVVAAALYLDVSRSVYLAEAYVADVARRAFPEIFEDGRQIAWYWERFASEGRRPLFMRVIGGLKVGAAFVVPTVGSMAAFWYFRSPGSWNWYEWLMFCLDGIVVAALIILAELVHHVGRPVQPPEDRDDDLNFWDRLRHIV